MTDTERSIEQECDSLEVEALKGGEFVGITNDFALRLVAALRSERTQKQDLLHRLEIEEGTSAMLATDRDDALNDAEALRAELSLMRTRVSAFDPTIEIGMPRGTMLVCYFCGIEPDAGHSDECLWANAARPTTLAEAEQEMIDGKRGVPDHG